MRWNGSVLGRKQPEGKGLWSLRAHALLRQANDWPYPVSLPITANLILHLDASRPENVTLNGGFVSAITDLSPSARTVDQTTAARQPAYIVNARNGLNALAFTAASTHFLNLASTTVPASHTVFVAFSRNSSGVFSSNLGNTANSPYIGTWWNDNIIYQQSNATFTTHGTANTDTGWFYMTTRRNATTQIRVRRNGSTVADVTTGTGVTNAASGSWTTIGRVSTAYTTGEIGEIIAYDTNLSDSDVDSVEAYLAAKWNI